MVFGAQKNRISANFTHPKASSSFDHPTPPCTKLFRDLQDELSHRANMPMPEDLNVLEAWKNAQLSASP